MPTFQSKPETVDAREYTGGVQNGTDLVFWIESNNGHALWIDRYNHIPEMIRIEDRDHNMVPAFVGDWIVRRQNGFFEAMRPEVFTLTYNQV